MKISPSREGSANAQHFRRVMGRLPTGVTVITAIDDTGRPVGMTIGSVTSVSLDPPLFAFLPDRRSGSFARIRTATSFCVNVLGADAEELCRAFAGRGDDKFSGVEWAPAPSGAPVLAGSIAWIDCAFDRIIEAGDHYFVTGAVTDLDVIRDGLPLLFFQGGYGRFQPRTITAGPEAALVDQFRAVDIARPFLESLAQEHDMECLTVGRVGAEMVITSSVGSPSGSRPPARVGQRIPFVPPLGGLFAAWGPPEVREGWLDRSDGPADRARNEELLDALGERGWSIAMEGAHREIEAALSRVPLRGLGDVDVHEIRQALERMGEYEILHSLLPDRKYDVRQIGVPVFAADGSVTLLLVLYRLPPGWDGTRVSTVVEALLDAARRIGASARETG